MITRGRDEECVSELRLSIPSFDLLCSLLKNRGLLMDTREVTVEEEVATLLHMLARGVRIRTMATRFFRSGETISRHFHEVLNAILFISPNLIKRAGSDTPTGPHPFEGAVGALDGTHVPAHLPISIQSSFRNRKGTLTQNVLAACGFDMKFQYVLPGWEGSATDARILQHALSRPDGLIIPTATPSLRKNTVFDSVMDEELLALMLEQIEMGRRGDRGFKSEAYVAVAKSMTESSGGKYKITEATIRNRCKKLKVEYASVTEMLNASGFGFDSNTHRIVADDEIWAEWLKGHPKANSWKSRTIDYDKLSMVFGRDIATGQFARSSVNATTGNIEQTTQGNANMSGNMDIAIEHMMHDVRMSSSGCGANCSASRNKKRDRGMSEFMVGFKASSHEIREAIDAVAEKMVDPTERLSTIVYKELKLIENLSEEDIEITHEWLNAHLDKATAFIDVDDKRAWIMRRMQRIRAFATA